jgi:hypothetical protein
MKILLYVLMACALLCCQSESQPDIVMPEGTYTGTFQRGSGRPFQVELTFLNGRYSGNVIGTAGNGNGTGYPPRICKGNFNVSPGAIYFENECFFTAEFDWSLILSQQWKAELTANRLTVSRNDDRYSLIK